MLLSEALYQKSIEDDNVELYKIASEIKYTEDDKEILEKDAGMWQGLASTGKTLMTNKVIKNAAIGTGVGAVAGAIQADDGKRVSGALKGGLIGGAIGGLGTAAKNIGSNYSSLKNTATGTDGKLIKGVSRMGLVGQAAKIEGENLAGTVASSGKAFQLGKAGVKTTAGSLTELPNITPHASSLSGPTLNTNLALPNHTPLPEVKKLTKNEKMGQTGAANTVANFKVPGIL